MLPILDAFHKGQGRQVRIDTLKKGDRAIILSLNFVGAIVVEVRSVDTPPTSMLPKPTWVSGTILLPKHLAYLSIRAAERIHMTFNRQGDTSALPLSNEEFEALASVLDSQPTVV